MIFLYEFVSGGGCYSLDGAGRPVGSLLVEGRLMARAVAEDLSRLPGVEVAMLRDARLDQAPAPNARSYPVASREQEERTFKRLAAAAAGTLLIAPETAGSLLQRARWTIEAGGRLLGPGPGLIALASDKHRLAEHLIRSGLRAPQGIVIPAREPLPAAFAYPAVLKPLDGAGSCDVRLIAAWSARRRGLDVPARLEIHCPGIAASVAVLCGPGIRLALPACAQRLSGDGRFRYLGASVPLPAALAARAEAAALGAIESLAATGPGSGTRAPAPREDTPPAAVPEDHALPRSEPAAPRGPDEPRGSVEPRGPDEPRGYIGVDLALGPDPSGAQDVVIEINPRLTTSYVALRQALDQNLMAAMLAILEGERIALCGGPRAVQFELPRQL